MASRTYAHKIPFIVKINHNELLTYPATHDQIMFGSVERPEHWAHHILRTRALQEETGVKLLWGTANLFSHRPVATNVADLRR